MRLPLALGVLGPASLLTVAALSGCASTVDRKAETIAAQQAVDDFWRAIRMQDLELLSRLVGRNEDLVVLGTDSAERWVGSASFLAAEESTMQAFDVERLARREETLQVHPSGDVAWFSTVFDLEITVGGERSTFEGLRTTGVIAKRDGRWRLLQCHTSVPVGGQQVEYR